MIPTSTHTHRCVILVTHIGRSGEFWGSCAHQSTNTCKIGQIVVRGNDTETESNITFERSLTRFSKHCRFPILIISWNEFFIVLRMTVNIVIIAEVHSARSQSSIFKLILLSGSGMCYFIFLFNVHNIVSRCRCCGRFMVCVPCAIYFPIASAECVRLHCGEVVTRSFNWTYVSRNAMNVRNESIFQYIPCGAAELSTQEQRLHLPPTNERM